MPCTEQQIDASVRVRFTPAKIKILASAISLIVHSYKVRERAGASPLRYPFHVNLPARGFDRGTYNQTFMDKILALWECLITKSPNGRWLRLDAIQLRAAIFAIRANVKYARLVRSKERRKRLLDKAWLQFMDQAWLPDKGKASLHFDDRTIARLKAQSQSLIPLLERDMKKANRDLIKAIGKEQYAALTNRWKAHLRWMQLHIAYCRPWGNPLPGLRKRQQQDLDVLLEMTRRGLRNARHQQPRDEDLRKVIRLYARYARQGRQGNMTVHFLVENNQWFQNKHHLAQFAIDHLNLKELSKL
jgi:hypothetical protein